MGLKAFYEKFDNRVHVFSRKLGAKKSAKHYFELLKNHNLPIKKLASDQKKEINDIWCGQVKDFSTHEIVWSVADKFDPRICSEMLFRTKIELALNNFQLKYGFSEKNYFDKLIAGEPMPKTIVRNVNGVFLSYDYEVLSKTQVVEIISKYEKLIVKPSIENGCGRAVKLYNNSDFESIFTDFSKDYLIQEVLHQHSSVAALNPSSINVVRVVSLSLNGEVSPVNCTLRCGAEGAVTDNFITKDGRGMFVIGVNRDGVLKDEAYHSCGERISNAPNGKAFAGIKLPNFQDALEMTTRIHKQLPHFGFIGFDVCFDEDGSPRIMELNFRGPGVLYYQYANGPLFGDRTDEVIATIVKKG